MVGALVAAPGDGWIVRRKKLHSAAEPAVVPWHPSETKAEAADKKAEAAGKKPEPAPISVERAMNTFLLILIAVLAGQSINAWAKSAGVVLPGFLTAMMAGVVITNGADLCRRKLEFEPIERDGELALRTFLVMYLMSLKLGRWAPRSPRSW